MPMNLMTGALSAIFLRSRGVSDDKMFAGAALSAMTPGMLGLAIPLALANQQQAADAGGDGETETETLYEMPDVIGQPEDAARKTLSSFSAQVTVKDVDLKGGQVEAVPGTVVWQSPGAHTPVAKGDGVQLYVQAQARVTASA